MVKGSTSTLVTKNVAGTETPNESKKYAYSNNYKGKNLMTMTHWKRYQRSKKNFIPNSKRPAKERLSLPPVRENPNGDD